MHNTVQNLPNILLSILLLLLAACTPTPAVFPPPPATATTYPAPTETPQPTPSPTPTLPPIVGSEPSYRVAAFYYPWYKNPTVDGAWDHWEGPDFRPPLDVSSDYYPLLGAYSATDPAVVARHFAWLRQAGVGLVIVSWWGQRTREERAVPVLLEMGQRYGIQIAFHVEPYGGRTAGRLVEDVQYLYAHYGDHPAFYRTTASTRWSPDDRSKGAFFVWLIERPDTQAQPVEATYWREAIDAIHALPDGGLVIANTTRTGWVDGGHFDGLYNYATLHLDEGEGFGWARGLPPDTWYVPGVIPGFSARRIGYPDDTYVPRQDGATYDEQWQAALGTGVEPALVSITSFNEWHEGTQIEPAAAGADNGMGYTYVDYSPLSPEGYLALTRRWAEQFLATAWPPTYRVRIHITTTSDWTTFGLVDGGTWLRPDLVSASPQATYAWLERGRFLLTQPITRSEAGGSVEMVMDVLIRDVILTGVEEGETLGFEIERGHLGSTQVELSNYLGPEPVAVGTFEWGGINPGERNAHPIQVPAAALLDAAP